MVEVDDSFGQFAHGIFLAQPVCMEHALAPPSNLHGRVRKLRMPTMGRIEEVNKELWLLLSIFGICLVLNYALASQRMVLSLYTFPTLVSAYVYGRRHATLTAFASVLIVVLLQLQNPSLRLDIHDAATMLDEWLDVIAWGSVLMITGYSMGTLYEHRSAQLLELRETYNGVLMLLRHFISKDKDIADGVVWRDPERVGEWMGELKKDEPVVVYCAYGFHVGCRTAITLREAGFDAKYMNVGHSGWRAVGAPTKLYSS